VAAVEEEEEEGAVDCDGDRMANGNRGPIAHSDRKDSNRSAASRARRMRTTIAVLMLVQ
jgi:hypothetical protein